MTTIVRIAIVSQSSCTEQSWDLIRIQALKSFDISYDNSDDNHDDICDKDCDESDEERFVTTFVQQSAKVASDWLDLIRIQSLTPVDKQNSGEGWRRRELPRWELFSMTIVRLAKPVIL